MRGREVLVRDMFQAGRSIVDVGRALIARMEDEEEDADRMRWETELVDSKSLRRKWSDKREHWRQMYLD